MFSKMVLAGSTSVLLASADFTYISAEDEVNFYLLWMSCYLPVCRGEIYNAVLLKKIKKTAADSMCFVEVFDADIS